MQADAIELHRLPIEEEALPVDELRLADAEDGFFFIDQLAAGIDGDDCLV